MKMSKQAVLTFALVLLSAVAVMPTHALAKEAKAAEIPVSVQMAKVNLNQANLEQLESIKGVGPALAERISTYRKENGNFKTVEDLRNVKGIGQAKFDRIKDQITV